MIFAQGVSLGVDERISKILPEEQCFCLFVCLFCILKLKPSVVRKL